MVSVDIKIVRIVEKLPLHSFNYFKRKHESILFLGVSSLTYSNSEMYRETDFKNTLMELESELNVPITKTYDFIVVGSGSSGSVLVARLSEKFNVLLLKAGGPPPPATAVIGIIRTHTGKMLGGSASHNSMTHSRGSPKNFDNWESILNDESFKLTLLVMITVKVPLEAVGKHLQDHTGIALDAFSVNETSMLRRINSSDMKKLFEEFHNVTGILTTNGFDIGHCFIASSKYEPDWPDFKIDYHTVVTVDEEPFVAFLIIMNRPKSVGMLTMDADKYKAGIRDDAQLALIDFQILTHSDDVAVILEAIKLVFDIIETQAFRSINLTFTGEPDPACNHYWRCRIQYDAETSTHMTGTCRMGPDTGDSNTSVVDTKFRVVDASVIPEITNSNINAPIMMLAEKAAEEIINFYSVPEPDRQ